MDGIIIFLIIVLGAALISWILMGCPAPRRVDHYHYHKYKMSTDYERLWDLIVNQGVRVVVDHGTEYFRIGEAWRGEDYCSDMIYGIGGEISISKGKEKFINYCTYKGIKFFDLADEVKDTE